MSCCSGCSSYSAAEQQFGSAIARRDLQRYRRKGPDASTRVMLEIVASDVHAGASLLDIGGGVGVMSFELLSRGVREATLVDASPACLDAARSEAERRGVASQLRCVGGDVVGVVGSVAPADVVTMHRVVLLSGMDLASRQSHDAVAPPARALLSARALVRARLDGR